MAGLNVVRKGDRERAPLELMNFRSADLPELGSSARQFKPIGSREPTGVECSLLRNSRLDSSWGSNPERRTSLTRHLGDLRQVRFATAFRDELVESGLNLTPALGVAQPEVLRSPLISKPSTQPLSFRVCSIA